MYNDKAHVTMEPMTRKMIIPKETKFIGVVGDNEGERVDIDIPRWYDGIDLGEKKIYIVVSNDGGESDMIIPDVSKDEEQIHLTWIVKGKHVANEGSVYAHIRIADDDGFVWQSLDAEFVAEATQEGPEVMPDPQITAVNQTLREMEAAKNHTLNAVSAALAAATFTAPPIIENVSGDAITISDSAARPLRAFTVYGRTMQDETPTANSPVGLVNVGANGSIVISAKAGLPESTEENAQNVMIATPDALPGVPCKSGGNYTDAGGQMWFSDFFQYDANAGQAKRVKMNAHYTAKDGYGKPYKNGSEPIWRIQPENVKLPNKGYPLLLCNRYARGSSYSDVVDNNCTITVTSAGLIIIHDESLASAEAVGEMLTSGAFELIYPLSESEEIEMEAVDIAQLHTYSPETTIYNNDNAHMSADYVVDTKTYIDNLVASAVAVALANK